MKNLIMLIAVVIVVSPMLVYGGQPTPWSGSPHIYGSPHAYGAPSFPGYATPGTPYGGYGYYYHERSSSDCCSQPAPPPQAPLVITNNNTPQFAPQQQGFAPGQSSSHLQDITSAMAAIKFLEYFDLILEAKRRDLGVSRPLPLAP